MIPSRDRLGVWLEKIWPTVISVEKRLLVYLSLSLLALACN